MSEQKDNREKIAKYLHRLLKAKKPIAWYWDWECELENTKELFRRKAKHIISLFPDESEIIGKIKLTVETELALERDIIKQINEAKIEKAKREERERIRMAFWEVFKGAGEVWFPYPPSGSEEECEGGVQNCWDELLEALKAGK